MDNLNNNDVIKQETNNTPTSVIPDNTEVSKEETLEAAIPAAAEPVKKETTEDENLFSAANNQSDTETQMDKKKAAKGKDKKKLSKKGKIIVGTTVPATCILIVLFLFLFVFGLPSDMLYYRLCFDESEMYYIADGVNNDFYISSHGSDTLVVKSKFLGVPVKALPLEIRNEKIKEIIIEEGSENVEIELLIDSKEGTFFDYSNLNVGSEAVEYYSALGYIPEGITTVTLKNVTIPDNGLKIPDSAKSVDISSCENVNNITYGSSVKALSISKSTFGNDETMAFTVPNSVMTFTMINSGYSYETTKTVEVEEEDKTSDGEASDGAVSDGKVSDGAASDNKKVTTKVITETHTSSFKELTLSDKTVELYLSGVSVPTLSLPNTLHSVRVSYNSLIESITVPSSITSLQDEAFAGNSALKSISLPSGLKTIGNDVFPGTGLQTLIIPDGVISIGNNLVASNLYYTTHLTTLYIPSSVREIGTQSFPSSITNLTVPTSLEKLVVPKEITNLTIVRARQTEYLTVLGASADNVIYYDKMTYINCYGCSKLTDITLPEGITSIGADAFEGCTNLQSLTIPEGVTSIEADAFKDCTSLKSVTLPEGVTSIGARVFNGCTNLQSVNIPEGVTSIEADAFKDCTSLKSVTLPEGVTSIGSNTFSGCTALQSVSLPDSIASIGANAFKNCLSMKSFVAPDSLKSVGREAFANCDNLSKVSVSDIAIWCGISFENASSNPLSYTKCLYVGDNVLDKLTVPEGVTSLSAYAFYNCTSILTVTLPSSIKSFGEDAFYGCQYIHRVYYTDLSAWCGLSFANDKANPLTYAGNLYLDGELLSEFELPDGLTRIESYAFSGCKNLSGVFITDLNTWLNVSFGNASANPLSRALTLYLNGKPINTLTLPDGIKEIGTAAFSGGNFNEVIFPESLISIGSYAFYNCYYLTTLVLPENVTTVGDYAFAQCKKIYSISVPNGITAVGKDAFDCSYYLNKNTLDNINYLGNEETPYLIAYSKSNSYATKIVLQDTCKILYCSFANSTIESFTGGDGLLSIPASAFYRAEKLKEVKLGENVNSIGDNAFESCESLTSITIPSSVQTIGDSAFNNCSGLESVTLSNSVTSIGEEVFYACHKLTAINFGGTKEEWESLGVRTSCTVNCTDGTIKKENNDYGY